MTTHGTALITGASSGIGAAYADRLARRGYDLVLVARDRKKLDALAAQLRQQTGRSITTLRADLTVIADLNVVEMLLQEDGRINMLVNNAGLGSTATLLDSAPAMLDELIALNVLALTRLTRAAAPPFAARGAGTIINIASIAALAPERINGVYSATKAFVLALTQSLHHELKDKGLRIQAVLPGATGTQFWERAGRPVHQLPAGIVMAVEDMVDAALAGLDMGEVVTLPALPDVADWNRLETARLEMGPNLSRAVPAARYRPTA